MSPRWISRWPVWALAARTLQWVLASPPAQLRDGLEAHRARHSAHSCGNEACNTSFIQNCHLTFLAKMHLVPVYSCTCIFLFPHLFILRIIWLTVLVCTDYIWCGEKQILCPGQLCSYFPWLHKPHYLRSCSVNLHNQFYFQ